MNAFEPELYSILIVDQRGVTQQATKSTGFCAQHALELAIENGAIRPIPGNPEAVVRCETRFTQPIFRFQLGWG